MFDKECTGNLDAVIKYLDTIDGSNSNWINGTKGKFKISAKVFATPSDFGIKNGRISKIQVCDISQEHWGFDACYLNYDRGWDIRPKDAETLDFINGLLVALGDDKLEVEDLLYYSLYTYGTEEDFEDGNRLHQGDFSFKENAMEEARFFAGFEVYGETTDEDPCAVTKVISSDDEEIEIIRKPVPTEEERVAAFTKELDELSTKHGITVEFGKLKLIEE